MAEYHVGIGGITNTIYAGTLNKKGTLWMNRSDVTHEAVDAVAAYLIQTEQNVKFTFNGKRYKMSVEEISE